MATIYQHNANDRVLVLEPREALQRKFDVGSWTELRMGFYIDNVGLGTIPTGSTADETVTQVTRSDIIAIGLKDSATSILPGFSGSYFIGLAMTASHNTSVSKPSNSYTRYNNSSADLFYGTGFYGTSSYYGAQTLSTIDTPLSATNSDYNSFYGLRFVINNSGSASQTISIYTSMTNNISYTGTIYYSTNYLTQAMQNATYGTVSTVTWNSGGSALPIPDSIWIRTPYYNNRLRISTLKVTKIV